jgi:hypothetical protein
MSTIVKVEEEAKQYLKDVGMESQISEWQVVFIGGKFSGDENYMLVTVSIEPKSLWPLETMVESTHQWSIENVKQYVEHSRIKTTIS